MGTKASASKRKRQSRQYRLPSNESTANVDKYCDSWRRFAKPICEMTNSRLFGFDPSISIILPSGQVEHLSWEFVDEFNKGLDITKPF